MTFFSRLFIFGGGLVTGAYLDQKYKLPNVENKFNEYLIAILKRNNLINENDQKIFNEIIHKNYSK